MEFIISPIFLKFSPHTHALKCALPFPVTNKKQEKGEKKRTSTRATVQQSPTLSFVIETVEVRTASE